MGTDAPSTPSAMAPLGTETQTSADPSFRPPRCCQLGRLHVPALPTVPSLPSGQQVSPLPP